MSTITEKNILKIQKDILLKLIENHHPSGLNIRNSEIEELTLMSSKMTELILDSSIGIYNKQQLLLVE